MDALAAGEQAVTWAVVAQAVPAVPGLPDLGHDRSAGIAHRLARSPFAHLTSMISRRPRGPAGEEHRFAGVTGDFSVLVIFGQAEGTRA